ncbi:MAG TPA: methylated-DNA--[protein]-cysteine S-methyltransferase [Methylomirabilota bacterium]|nr:methylated-DNA--[protein]-cysteine S-methyltransferase [Methylomirabilota bacterium]
MNAKPRVCEQIEQDLMAAAAGEAEPAVTRRVHDHIGVCAPCGGEYARYRALEHALGSWRQAPLAPAIVEDARKRLESRLGELKRRTLAYRIFPSPLGNILIAASEQGVSLIEYLGRAKSLSQSRLSRLHGVETIEDGEELERLYHELLEYLGGRRSRFGWPLDLRLVRSDFHRSVLRATAEIPYGALMSYSGVACEVGKPTASRAVAQALRWNPLPIVIPCHRVVGSTGSLVGYAGDKISLKEHLLCAEGICIERTRPMPQVNPDAMYVGEPRSRWYCLPTCPSLESLAHRRRLVFFGTRQRAEGDGREPCDSCRPDLHPLNS